MIVVVLGVALQLVGYFNAALLRTGKPLTWQASKGYLTSIRHEGARQFISHYNRCKLMESPEFVWGDEIEFGILKSDKATNQIDLSLRAGTETRSSPTMREITNLYPSMIHDDANLTLSTDVPSANDCEWQPEYGSWMIEAVPKRPFKSDTLYDLMNAEKSMQLRRKRLHRELAGNEIAPTLTAFPMMGVKSYPHTAHIVNFDDLSTHKSLGNDSPSQSSYVSDALINEHPRFAALTRNIRLRRGSKVDIVVPADTHPDEYECTVHLPTGTTTPVLAAADVASSCTAKSDGALNNTKEEDIHMDAMAFGMGCSCLQVTIQAHNEDESRFLHDQLAIMAPILHALSAATPILKGRLAATDTRWNVISQAVDDRTPAERRPINIKSESIIDERNIVESCRDVEMVGEGVRRLSQSRYSEVPLFIARTEGAAEDAAMAALNDIEVAIDDDIYDILRTEGGVDENLSRHIAHLFVRDPLVIFDDSVPVETGAQSLVTNHNFKTSQLLPIYLSFLPHIFGFA